MALLGVVRPCGPCTMRSNSASASGRRLTATAAYTTIHRDAGSGQASQRSVTLSTRISRTHTAGTASSAASQP
jgi:hypothetical protein